MGIEQPKQEQQIDSDKLENETIPEPQSFFEEMGISISEIDKIDAVTLTNYINNLETRIQQLREGTESIEQRSKMAQFLIEHVLIFRGITEKFVKESLKQYEKDLQVLKERERELAEK
ncbi:MAG: hypothetical protein V1845_03810 [bacterium]